MVHWIDAVQFIQDIGLPAEITTIGDQLATQGVWETPDTIQTLMRFPKAGVQVHFEGTFVNAHGRPGITIMGEDATLFVDRRRLELIPEAGRKTEALDLMPGGGGDVPHLADWIAAIRTRRKPSAPAEAGVLAAHIAQLGNEAYRQGRVIRLEG
jgi:predicted dehydrogenase